MRRASAMLACALAGASACRSEPRGTAVALDTAVTGNKSDDAARWGQWATKLEAAERFDEALFASAEELALARECYGHDEPLCVGELERRAPSTGVPELINQLLWRRRLTDSLHRKAQLLTRRGAPKVALKPLDEAIRLEPSHPYLWEAKGDALFALARHAEALEAYRAGLGKQGREWYMTARIARCLAQLGRVDEAKTTAEELTSELASAKRRGVEAEQAQTELQLLAAEFP